MAYTIRRTPPKPVRDKGLTFPLLRKLRMLPLSLCLDTTFPQKRHVCLLKYFEALSDSLEEGVEFSFLFTDACRTENISGERAGISEDIRSTKGCRTIHEASRDVGVARQ